MAGMERELRETEWKAMDDVIDFLHSNGSRRIGTGNYSHVFKSDDPGNVVKVTSDDPCADLFTKFAMVNRSRYLPKIHFYRVYRGPAETPRGYPADKFAITVMEKLDRNDGRSFGAEIDMAIDYGTNRRWGGPRMEESVDYMNDDPKHPFARLILKIEREGLRNSPKCQLDMGEANVQNVLIRNDGTPVIADPLYYFR